MANLRDELFEMFPRSDCDFRRNKFGNYEIVLSREAAEHLAQVLHQHDEDVPMNWGRL